MTWITANFPDLPEQAKARVVAGTTTRTDGVSVDCYAGLNLANHVGDEIKNVAANRAILRDQLALPSEPYWLNQTHSATVIEIPYQYRYNPSAGKDSILEADASYTKLVNHVCTVMTADCLPLLIVDEEATKVAAIHAGWRGLAQGIIQSTIDALAIQTDKLHVWLGPAIGPSTFEVGTEVKDAFVAKEPANIEAFVATSPNKFLCDIYQLAKQELSSLGIKHISGGEFCTVSDAQKFYSYRRDGQTGRMASLIWLND